MAVSFTVTLRGKPLRRCYVSHYDPTRVPSTLYFMTNENGQVTVMNAGLANFTLDPTGPSGKIPVTVYAYNAVVQVFDGDVNGVPFARVFNNVSNNSSINIDTTAEGVDYFDIMDRCLVAYDTVFRQFSPYNSPTRRAYPFGKWINAGESFIKQPRIGVLYPDRNTAIKLAFVEPAPVSLSAFPLIHLKHKSEDARLFGSSAAAATLIPHEMAHALYLAQMPLATRVSVEVQYVAWITARVTGGLPPFHNTNLATTPFVAWIECLGIFAERFYLFSRQKPDLKLATLWEAFVKDELSAAPLLQNLKGYPYKKVGNLESNGSITQQLTGDNVEGALYGAIFLDFARRTSLLTAVNLYMDSVHDNVLNFDDFRNMIINDTGYDTHIESVASTWGL